MKKDDKYDLLTLAAGLLLVLVLIFARPAGAQEVTTGVTVRTHGITGEWYELTGYAGDWRYGLTYATTQTWPDRRLACGSLGADGEVCFKRDLYIKPYASVYAQRMWRFRNIYAGLGLALHEERLPILSLPFSFRTSVGYQFDRQWAVEWTHMSNARLQLPNYGQDVIVVRYRWKP